jgi:hypothetical protein
MTLPETEIVLPQNCGTCHQPLQLASIMNSETFCFKRWIGYCSKCDKQIELDEEVKA